MDAIAATPAYLENDEGEHRRLMEDLLVPLKLKKDKLLDVL